MTFFTTNPATGQPLKEYATMSHEEINTIISDCHQDFLSWSESSIKDRSEKLSTVAKLLEKNKKTYATLMAKEMGKPLGAGIAEIEKCALVCTYYAEQAETMLKPKVIQTNLKKSYVTYEPMGIVFAIMPWNFPFWQVFRFAAPNLMAGNGCLLKHAQISTGTALEIENLFQEAHLPTNLFRSLVINTALAAKVIAHPLITGVTLTGSEQAGKAVARVAGENLKKVVLELGGSDPYLILEDADLAESAKICVKARLNNSGQVCIAAKRLIVLDSVFEKFQQKVLEEINTYTLGNPLEPSTTLGPLAREDLRETVHAQVKQAVENGATLLAGGTLSNEAGYFYPPTVLSEVHPDSVAFKEEIFGPVICLIRAKNEEEAIKLANQTHYGLGAGVFTKNLAKGEEIAVNKLKAGTCAVNTAVHSDPKLPFGGIKNSGFGRELGENGLKSFLNIKSIQISE